ncbi:protein SLOW GREEN 1, chloroplastic isoform X2 [Ricinus communis]|uniref:protein SLOW GREEN 1, chloroplastic isoform X2 n=1 Tax=Ricinus communis TaxID=3988 RepID=UPI00201A5C8E|nr:protein SLOW GREEN 1, chloroplastic isoform X2 [Ricinus communis]
MGSVSQLNYHNPKLTSPYLSITPKRNLSITNPHYRQSLLKLPFHRTTKLLRISSKLSLSPIPHIPTSNSSKRKGFANVLCDKVLISVLGAFIFMGSFGFNARPSLALPAQESAYTEEMRDTQMKNNEDEEMYEKFLEKEPRNMEALKVVVYGKIRKGKTKEALKYVERLIKTEPDEVEWRLLEALCWEMMGQFSKAKRLFKEILEERPLLLRALHGRLEEGLKNFQDLVNENPRDFRPYLCQGIIYSLLDKKEEAAEQFETYRSLLPEDFPQRGFLDDVVLAAKTESKERFRKEFEDEFSYRK